MLVCAAGFGDRAVCFVLCCCESGSGALLGAQDSSVVAFGPRKRNAGLRRGWSVVVMGDCLTGRDCGCEAVDRPACHLP
jgi:hypothetical protein